MPLAYRPASTFRTAAASSTHQTASSDKQHPNQHHITIAITTNLLTYPISPPIMADVLRAISDMVLRLSRLLFSTIHAQNEELESTKVITTSARPSSARPTAFRLLDLPPEVRNHLTKLTSSSSVMCFEFTRLTLHVTRFATWSMVSRQRLR